MWVGNIKGIRVLNLDLFGLWSRISMKVSEASRKSHNGINKMITIWAVICWLVISRTIITWITWVWVTTWERWIPMVAAVIIV